MKKAIWKFQIPIEDLFSLEMPKGAEILSAQNQYEGGVMWAICDEQAEKVQRTFRIYGTGHSINPDGHTYIGTFQVEYGRLVWHLFEITKK